MKKYLILFALSALCVHLLSWLRDKTAAIHLESLRSGHWPVVRGAFIKDNPTCAACGEKATQVHHVKPFHLHPELELDPANLISMCDRDHLLFGHLDNFKSYNPDVRQDCATMLVKIQGRPQSGQAHE